MTAAVPTRLTARPAFTNAGVDGCFFADAAAAAGAGGVGRCAMTKRGLCSREGRGGGHSTEG
eukprot:355040-Chlamydomonas_euryale.AAC.23